MGRIKQKMMEVQEQAEQDHTNNVSCKEGLKNIDSFLQDVYAEKRFELIKNPIIEKADQYYLSIPLN